VRATFTQEPALAARRPSGNPRRVDMARRPNYGAEKRQKEIQRQKKKDEKDERKRLKKEAAAEGAPEGGAGSAGDDDDSDDDEDDSSRTLDRSSDRA